MKDLQTVFKEQEEYAISHKVPIMENVEELCNSVCLKQPKNILEIGTAIGYSGLKMLSNCGGTLTTIELDEERQNTAKAYAGEVGFASRITFLLGDACEIIRYLDGKYDFIFLDGPKGHYAEMLPYIKNLLCENGVLFADDISFKGKTAGDDYPAHKHRTIVNSLRTFVKELQNDKEYNVEIKDVGDGILIARKK